MKEKIIIGILKKNYRGLTITELVKISNLPRSTLRTILARLEGAGKIGFRRVGMAKVYSPKPDTKEVLVKK